MTLDTTAPQSLPPVLHLAMGSNTGMSGGTAAGKRVRPVDLYDLDRLALDGVRGLLVNGNCDQIFLERRRVLLTDFVTAGGRVAVMGHPLTDFLPGLGQWRKLQYSGPKDLAIIAGDPHPVWEGVDTADVSFRRGVSGFYARGYSQKLPDDDVVTTASVGTRCRSTTSTYWGRVRSWSTAASIWPCTRRIRTPPSASSPQLLTWLARQEAQA